MCTRRCAHLSANKGRGRCAAGPRPRRLSARLPRPPPPILLRLTGHSTRVARTPAPCSAHQAHLLKRSRSALHTHMPVKRRAAAQWRRSALHTCLPSGKRARSGACACQIRETHPLYTLAQHATHACKMVSAPTQDLLMPVKPIRASMRFTTLSPRRSAQDSPQNCYAWLLFSLSRSRTPAHLGVLVLIADICEQHPHRHPNVPHAWRAASNSWHDRRTSQPPYTRCTTAPFFDES